MQDSLVIGVIGGEVSSVPGLAQAAVRHPGLLARTLTVDEPVSDNLAGLIVDVPLEQRAGVLQLLTPRWRVPILVESPVAGNLESARAVAGVRPGAAIVATNPLRYALHTQRLLEEVVRAEDPLQTFFAAWRFRAQSPLGHALPQLLDYLEALAPGSARVCRVSAMHHPAPSVLTVTLRYASDVLGSIEVGSHLAGSFESDSELVVECFCTGSAYVCVPSNQTVQLYGRGHAAYAWQPEPADTIVAAFAAWLSGGPRPVGSLANDISALRLVDRINQALQAGGVDAQDSSEVEKE